MIKTLNKYSGLISAVVLIVGFAMTLQTFGFTLVNKIDDITVDHAEFKFDSIQRHKESDKNLNEIKNQIDKQVIHDGYLRIALIEQTRETKILIDEFRELNVFLRNLKKTGFIEISRNGVK